MPMISYAQNREDVLLNRLFPRGVKGFYIDIGANDPVKDSVTKHFYDLGWHGINVEPGAEPFQKLEKERPRDVNLNVGVSNSGGTLTFFECPPELSGRSTFAAEQAQWHRDVGFPFDERAVEVTTLARICEEHVEGEIDFLSIDVEGYERQVIEGGDWQRWRPRVVVVEAIEPGRTIPSHEEWEKLLLDADYLFAAFDGLNRYYIRQEDRQLLPALSTPVNVTDDYAPYEYWKQAADLRWAHESSSRHLAAARAYNATLAARYAEFSQQLNHLTTQYQNVERALTSVRAHYESVRTVIADAETRYARLQAEMLATHAHATAAQALFTDIGPSALGVARRLGRLTTRYPRAASATTRSLRLALAVKRRLTTTSG